MEKLTFKTANNEVEYKALVPGLSIVEVLGATKVIEVRDGTRRTIVGPTRYLDTRELLDKKEEVGKIQRRAMWFTQIDEILYKRDFLTPLLRCVSP